MRKTQSIRHKLLSFLLAAVMLVSLAPAAMAAPPRHPYERNPVHVDKVFPLLPHNVDVSQKLIYKITLDPGGYEANGNLPENQLRARTAKEVLEYMEEIDNWTRGVPKLAILVGFQDGGHDNKYPQWGPLNPHIKSGYAEDPNPPEDAPEDGAESLHYIMKKSKSFNTECTVHVNIVDIYENISGNSPLWKYYDENGIIARKSDGNYYTGWEGPANTIGTARNVSLLAAYENDNGIRKQVDYLFKQLPELLDTGVLYTDANGAVPASPYDGITMPEQYDVYRQIVSYIRQRYHVDVIAEYGFDGYYGYISHGLTWAQGDSEGFRTGSYKSPMKVPAYITAAGRGHENTNNDMRIFGYSVQLERPEYHSDTKTAAKEIVRTTIPYLFLNSKLRLSYDSGAQYAEFSDGVKSMLYTGSTGNVGNYTPDEVDNSDSGYITIKRAYGTAPNGSGLTGQPSTPEYLYLMENDNGDVVFGTYADPTDRHYHWERSEGGDFYLKNRATDHYLTFSSYSESVTERKMLAAAERSDAFRFFVDTGDIGIAGSVRLCNNQNINESAYMGYWDKDRTPKNHKLLPDSNTATNEVGAGVYYITNSEVGDWKNSTTIDWVLEPVTATTKQYVKFTFPVNEQMEMLDLYDDNGTVKAGNGAINRGTTPAYFWEMTETTDGARYKNCATGQFLTAGIDGVGNNILTTKSIGSTDSFVGSLWHTQSENIKDGRAPFYTTFGFPQDEAGRLYACGANIGSAAIRDTQAALLERIDQREIEEYWRYFDVSGSSEFISNKYVISQNDSIYKISSGNGNSIEHNTGAAVTNHYDLFMPLPWRVNEVMAYSDDGSERIWTLPPDWPEDAINVDVYEITKDGLNKEGKQILPVIAGHKIKLAVNQGQLLTIVPAGTDVDNNRVQPSGATAAFVGVEGTGSYGGLGRYLAGGAALEGVELVGSATKTFRDGTKADTSELHQIVRVNTAGETKKVTLYLLDQDNEASQTLIEVLDPNTSAGLASTYVDKYQNGKYVSFDVSGQVDIRLTRIYGEELAWRGPVYLAGVFLDEADGGKAAMPAPNIFRQTKLLRDSQIEYNVEEIYNPTGTPELSDLVGQRAALRVEAVSRNNGTLCYQWQRTLDGSSWVNLEGSSALTDTYLFDPLTQADTNYSYRCVVADSRKGWTEGTSESQPLGMKRYQISIVGGTAVKTSAYAGELVAISADNMTGKYFERWSASVPNVTFTDVESAGTSFVMPVGDVVISAVFGVPSTGGGEVTTINTAYIPQGNIKFTNDRVTITATKDTSTVSAGTMKKIAGENLTKAVTIRGPGYEITFPKGSIAQNETIADCNFGLIFDGGADYVAIKALTGDNLVRHLHFNQAGAFPGEGHTTVLVGARYAGQNLVYSFYNPNSGKLEKHSDALVDKDGYVTVIQTHAGDYAFTTAETPPVFEDTVGHWAEKAIMWVNQRGLLVGVGKKAFAPDTAIDRGMFVTVLHRLAMKPKGAAVPAFSDVSADAYYADAVAWATEQGVADGAGGGAFLPGQMITREQLITMLYRYARYSGSAIDGNGDLGGFTDGAQVSSWAQDAMVWAVRIGLLQGKGGSRIDPAGTATRSETAVTLQRFCEMIEP